MPDITREQVLNASLGMTEGAQKVAAGIPMLLEENPDLNPDVKELLEIVAVLVPMLCGIFIQSFERALEAEDALDEVKELLDQITVED